LPLSYADLAKKVSGYWDTFTKNLKVELLKNNVETIFPRGEGSTQLLHTVVTTDFLYMIGRKPDSTWDIFSPNDTQDASLPKNGFVSYGGMTGAMFIKVRKPDDVPAATFYSDSKLYMDYVLKAVPLKRPIGPEQIRIVSLGKASEDSVFTDRYGRKWQARVWPVRHEDICIYSLSLPVPSGYVSMMRAGQPASLAGTKLDLEEMASFAYISYAGTLEQWRGFLSQKTLLPATFDTMAIDYDYEKSFKYRSKRMTLNFAAPLHKIGPQSLLTLDFSYFPDGGKVTWDVAGVTVSEKKSGGATVSIDRRTKPAESLPDSYANEWTKMQERQYPYDGTIVDNAGTAFVEGIYPKAAPAKDSNVLYVVGYSAEGKKTQDEMSTLLKRWFEGLSVAE
jgi:serine protease Do